MSAFEQGQEIGRKIGIVIAPFIVAALIVVLYEKMRKQPVERRILKIFILGLVLLLLSIAGNWV